MKRFFIAAIVSIAFLFLLSQIDSATNIGNTLLSASVTQTQLQLLEKIELQAGNVCTAQQTIINQTNAERAKRGLRPLIPDPVLMWSAQLTAQTARWVYKGRDLQHSPEFPAHARVPRPWSGENAALGSGARSVVNGWMNSPGHRSNMLNPRWRYIGVGFANTGPGRGTYSYQQFRSSPARVPQQFAQQWQQYQQQQQQYARPGYQGPVPA